MQAYYELLCDKKRKLDEDAKVLVLWGETGTGKTKRAYEVASSLSPDDNYYVKTSYNQWWQGYRGQEVVLIDEYAGQWPMPYLLLVLDRYALTVEYKGGSANLRASKFILTSNIHPDEWYPHAKPEHLAALKRRLSKVVEIKDKNANYDLTL